MPISPINHSMIERLPEYNGGVPHDKGLRYVYENVVGGRPDPPPRAPPVTACPSQSMERAGLSDTLYRRLTRRMDAMHNIHHRFAQDLT